jgi:hypothetical protein
MRSETLRLVAFGFVASDVHTIQHTRAALAVSWEALARASRAREQLRVLIGQIEEQAVIACTPKPT